LCLTIVDENYLSIAIYPSLSLWQHRSQDGNETQTVNFFNWSLWMKHSVTSVLLVTEWSRVIEKKADVLRNAVQNLGAKNVAEKRCVRWTDWRKDAFKSRRHPYQGLPQRQRWMRPNTPETSGVIVGSSQITQWRIRLQRMTYRGLESASSQ